MKSMTSKEGLIFRLNWHILVYYFMQLDYVIYSYCEWFLSRNSLILWSRHLLKYKLEQLNNIYSGGKDANNIKHTIHNVKQTICSTNSNNSNSFFIYKRVWFLQIFFEKQRKSKILIEYNMTSVLCHYHIDTCYEKYWEFRTISILIINYSLNPISDVRIAYTCWAEVFYGLDILLYCIFFV